MVDLQSVIFLMAWFKLTLYAKPNPNPMDNFNYYLYPSQLLCRKFFLLFFPLLFSYMLGRKDNDLYSNPRTIDLQHNNSSKDLAPCSWCLHPCLQSRF